MRLYKRGDTWWCSWPEGKRTVRKSTKCTTKDAAKLVAERWERERANPHHAAANQATLADEAQRWIDGLRRREAKPIAAGTLEMYLCKRGHLLRLLPAQLAHVDAKAVDRYFEARRAEGASTSTLYKEWVTLRGILYAASRRRLWLGELETLRPEWVQQSGVARKRRLTLSEVEALVFAGTAHGELFAFAAATGMRRAELRRARGGDYDPATGLLRVRGTKTSASARTIPVPAMLRHLIPPRASDRHAGLLFPHMPPAIKKNNAAASRANIAPFTFNDLRRTFSSLLIGRGVSNTVAAKLLGHTSTVMVDRVYGRENLDELTTLVRRQMGEDDDNQ